MQSNSLSLNSKPDEIRGCDPGSFANYTFVNRFPFIIDNIIAENKFDFEVKERLLKLKFEFVEGFVEDVVEGTVEGNVELDDLGGRSFWLKEIQPYMGMKWLDVPFLKAEMYFYKNILEIVGYFDNASALLIDPFRKQKSKHLLESIPFAIKLAKELDILRGNPTTSFEFLSKYIFFSLWGNQGDLSQMSLALAANSATVDKHKFILINELKHFLEFTMQKEKYGRVDIILDNSGSELLADLALASYLLESGLTKVIYLHFKPHPMFVSDATKYDFDLLMNALENDNCSEIQLWLEKIANYIDDHKLILAEHEFWGRPCYFRDMPADLVAMFGSSDLVIVKGDANYRRLIEDRHWPIDYSFRELVSYFPTSCLVLRVMKSEILVGVNMDFLSTLALNKNWMSDGKYAVLQFFEKQKL